MKLKRIAGAVAGLALLLGSAAFAQDQPQRSLAGEILEKLSAAGGIAVELAPAQAQPSEEEIAAMHMLLQLLMMQQQMGDEAQIIVPRAAPGVAI